MRAQPPERILLWALLTGVTLAAWGASRDYQVGVLWAWGVVLAVLPLLHRVSVMPADRLWLDRAWLVRLLVVLVLGVWVEGYYRLRTGLDADMYQRVGKYVAEHLRFYGTLPYVEPEVRWNGTIHYILQVGVVYWLLGASAQMMKVFNTLAAFLGTLGFYRMYRRVQPGSGMDLPLAFLFFMPSMLYWTTIHGKDPWMYAFLGMGMFFAGRFLERFRPWDFVGMALGILGMAWIRPHVAAIFALALVVFSLLQRYRRGPLNPLLRGFSLVVLGVVAFLAVRAVMEAFRVQNLEEALQFAVRQGEASAYGRTAIQLPEIRSFTQLGLFAPLGFVTVLFRPFPWEARSVFALISAVENLVLLVFSVQHLRRHRWRPTHPIGVMAGVYVLLFVLAFYPAMGNLGTLVRQKVQLLPFWFLYLGSLPPKEMHHVRD